MTIGIPLVGLPQVPMRIDLHHAEIGVAFGMGPNRPQRARMFTGQGDGKPPDPDMGRDERLNRIHRLLIDFAGEVERADRRHAPPLPIGLTAKRFVVQLNLLRRFDDG